MSQFSSTISVCAALASVAGVVISVVKLAEDKKEPIPQAPQIVQYIPETSTTQKQEVFQQAQVITPPPVVQLPEPTAPPVPSAPAPPENGNFE